MKETEKLKLRNKISMAVLGLAVVVMGALVLLAWKGWLNNLLFGCVLIGFFAVYVFLLDYIEPKVLGEFEDLTPERKKAYLSFLLTDIIGCGGLAFFVFTFSKNSTTGLIGAIVYIFASRMKREYRKKFLGKE